ncbi:MAG TPA: hypothetical protein VMV91_17535 [Rhodocyclaceae bacterium]|nr:hypothetical protein [Rhodocyclaceae bacterium]
MNALTAAKVHVDCCVFSNIHTVFDLNQTSGMNLALHFVTPFADFLPSFWAEGILRALGFLFSSVRFSFPARICTPAPEWMAA